MKVASDHMKAHYDQLDNSAGFQVGNLAVTLTPEKRKITQAADVLGRPVHHPVKRRHIPNSGESRGKYDGRPPGQPGNHVWGLLGISSLEKRAL